MTMFDQMMSCSETSYEAFKQAARKVRNPVLIQAWLDGTRFTFVRDDRATGDLIGYRVDGASGFTSFYAR